MIGARLRARDTPLPDNLFYALVARDQHCRWPGCTIRATWCDAHHIIEWTDRGPTTDGNCALLCHRHHQLSHQRGWKISGDATEMRVHHPDGSIEVSKPPGATAPRADTIGRERGVGHAPAHEMACERVDIEPEQLAWA